MAWLLRAGEVLASIDVADTPMLKARGFGALGDAPGAMLVERSRTAHSIGARSAIDVAYLDDQRVVVALTCLARYRLSLPRRNAASVLEAPRGAFERWDLRVGDRLEIRE